MQSDKRQSTLFIITMILMSIYLLWRMLFTLPLDQGFWNIVFGILLFVAEAVTVLTTFELFYQKMRKKRTELELPDIPPEYYPEVDVFIATHNEPVSLLYKTVNACTFMDYPDKRKVHIYLCDDGGRPEVEELAKQFGIGYLGFPDNKEAKSGNLNHALSKTSSPLIATFDADMIPQRTFLMKTVPYFLLPTFIKEGGVWRPRTEDELSQDFKLGLVQTPQSFYNPDLFQFNLYAEHGIPNEQDFFSREVNILRNATNAAAYTGSNTVILRKAMEEINGFPLHTITEDFETSIRLQQAGYITYATQEVQAAGLTTTTVQSMIKQRIRWGRGIIQSLKNTRAIFSSKLPFQARITYLCSYLYWWSFFFRLIFVLAPILFALFDFQIVNTSFLSIVIFWLPAYFFYALSMRHLSSNIRNQRWSQVIDTIFMPYLIIPIFLETIGVRERKFKVTNKSKSSGQKRMSSVLLALPYVFLLLLSVVALIRFVDGKYGSALLFSSIILFWLVYNMTALCYALFFMSGRRNFRETERIRAQADVTIQYKGRIYQAMTEDVSEQGIAMLITHPVYLPPETKIPITIRTERYEANLQAMIVHSDKQDDGWRYSAKVQPVSEQDKRHYMQVIYDRKHSLPDQLNPWDTAYDDMVRNVQRRFIHSSSARDKMQWIPLHVPVVFTNGASCTLSSANQLFIAATDLQGDIPAGALVTFYTISNIEVVLLHTGKTASNQREVLFSIENIKELMELDQVNHMMDDLIQSHSENFTYNES